MPDYSYIRDSYFILPLQSTAAAAGSGNAFNDLKPQPFFVKKKNRYSAEADTLIRVSGHSMEPVYHDGDMVYVKYTKDAENNDIVICTTADGAVIKRMYENKLYSRSCKISLPRTNFIIQRRLFPVTPLTANWHLVVSPAPLVD